MNTATSIAKPTEGPVLRDIHVPPAPPWWPPAPGWWIVLVVALVMGVVGLWVWRRQRRRRALERALLAEVDALVASHGDQPQRLAAGLHQLLRRAALRLDAGAAPRRGDAWRQTLAQVTMEASTLDALMTLESAMYKPGSSFDVDAAAAATRRWLLLAWRQRGARVPMLAASAVESGHA